MKTELRNYALTQVARLAILPFAPATNTGNMDLAMGLKDCRDESHMTKTIDAILSDASAVRCPTPGQIAATARSLMQEGAVKFWHNCPLACTEGWHPKTRAIKGQEYSYRAPCECRKMAGAA